MLRKHILPVAHETRDLIIEKMKDEAPVKTGALRDSIYGRVSIKGSSIDIVVAVPKRIKYAGWVVKGRGWVFPVKKKALWWPGLPHPVAYARPSKPNPFPGRALRRSWPGIRSKMKKITVTAARAVVR